MDKQVCFSDLEAILRNAIKLSRYSIKDLAIIADMSKSGLYGFSNGKKHISIERGDLLIKYLEENNPQALKVATNMYFDN